MTKKMGQDAALRFLWSQKLCAAESLHAGPFDIIGGLSSFEDETLKCTVYQDAFMISIVFRGQASTDSNHDSLVTAVVTGPGNLSESRSFSDATMLEAAIWVSEEYKRRGVLRVDPEDEVG